MSDSKTAPAMPRHNTNTADAIAAGWQVTGNPDVWELVCKASNPMLGIEKSTKRMKVPGGWVYQASTRTPSGVAEALAFVPDPTAV
jgi:hypothetical protein